MNAEMIRLLTLLRWLAREEEYNFIRKQWQNFQLNPKERLLYVGIRPTMHVFEFCAFLGEMTEINNRLTDDHYLYKLILLIIQNKVTISYLEGGCRVYPSIPPFSTDELRDLIRQFNETVLFDSDKEYIPSKNFNTESTLLAVALLKSLEVNRQRGINKLLSFGLFTRSDSFPKI